MSETKKKTAAPKPVSKKPYLTGKPLDSSCIGGALRFFLYLLMMAIAFLFLGAVLSFDSFTLRLIINLAVVLLMLTVMFQSGAAAGSVAVNAGELAYQRKESNRMLNDAEIRACYHPLKGFLTALIGSLPLLIAATVLACTTQRQMTSIGALPTWVSSMMDNVDNGAALAVYAQDGGGHDDSAHRDSHLHPARRQHCRCDEQRRNASLGAVQPAAVLPADDCLWAGLSAGRPHPHAGAGGHCRRQAQGAQEGE